MGVFDQAQYDVRCEWGPMGLKALAPISDVVILVDVLSFSTCFDVALSRGAAVIPCRWKDARAADLAAQRDALLAGPRGTDALSLSPASLRAMPADVRLVLPSPNGSALSMATGATPTFAGCLRNAAAVARAAAVIGRRIAVIPAGERWHSEDDSLRPALEDLLGAGALISALTGRLSPEAQLAKDAFCGAQSELNTRLMEASSGRELAARGFAEDVVMAAELNVSSCAPQLVDGTYKNVGT